MNTHDTLSDLNRRDFLKGGSFATLMMLMGGIPIRADDPKADEPAAENQAAPTPVKCAVIGCGAWGRELIKALATIPHGPIVALCDTYEPWLRRAAESAPGAQTMTDYRRVLDLQDVEAVIVATPTHLHHPIVFEALQAGKHVYCEAPLAHTIEDAKAIARAARDAVKLNFQAGLQHRADPQLYHLMAFVRAGAGGKPVKTRSQWHKKMSWRRSSPNPDREKELNWRLERAQSLGLVGELGIHQVDLAAWHLLARPTAVTGFGTTIQWNDGRDVPDTVQALFEYPRGALATFEASLASSFDGAYDLFFGTDSTIMHRERRAWMFKEADAPLLGWEVYARKEAFYKESGIVLSADATKLAAQGDKPVQDALADQETPLQHALKAFLANCALTSSAVKDFTETYGSADPKELRDYLASLAKSRAPAAGWQEGLEATIAVVKANEAIHKGTRIAFGEDLFALK